MSKLIFILIEKIALKGKEEYPLRWHRAFKLPFGRRLLFNYHLLLFLNLWEAQVQIEKPFSGFLATYKDIVTVYADKEDNKIVRVFQHP